MAVIRWATWNLWAPGPDRTQRLGVALSVLSEIDADLVCLQEACADAGVDAAARLGHDLDLHVARAGPVGAEWWSGRTGGEVTVENVILSRWPVADAATIELPGAPGGGEVRTAVQARVEAPDGPVRVVSTQLTSSPLDSARRVQQVRALVAELAASRRGDELLLVAGDLNAEPDSDEVRLLCGHKTAPAVDGFVLMDLWRFADGPDPGWTWDRANPHVAATREPSCRIDLLLAGPTPAGVLPEVHAIRRFATGPVDGVWASDHAGVVADLAP